MTVNLREDEGDMTTANGSKGDDTACRPLPSGATAALHANSKPGPSAPRPPPPPPPRQHNHNEEHAVSASSSSSSNSSGGSRARSTLECWLGGKKRVDPSATRAADSTAASTAASAAAAATTATSTPRGNEIEMRNSTTFRDGEGINPPTASGGSSGVGGLGKRPRFVASACRDRDPDAVVSAAGGVGEGSAADAVMTDAVAEAGKQFLRRYHHHIAFRRLVGPKFLVLLEVHGAGGAARKIPRVG